jgi:hypothetical protein
MVQCQYGKYHCRALIMHCGLSDHPVDRARQAAGKIQLRQSLRQLPYERVLPQPRREKEIA